MKNAQPLAGSDITIEDVDLQIENSGRYIEGKVQITIAMKNNSKTSTYYVLKRPRVIDYDKGSHTLTIGLYEKELPVSTTSFEPEQMAILPGTTFQWQYLLPLWMKKITRPPGLREMVEVLDISAVQKVDCTVAVLEPLSKWGGMVSASFDRTISKQ